MRTTLTRKGFKKWLERRVLDGHSIGRASTARSCPIANYLNAQSGGWRAARVAPVNYSLGNNMMDHDMPLWATQFVRRIDTIYGNGQINPKYALTVLEDMV